jgi:lycopene cyclase domain-containing protein
MSIYFILLIASISVPLLLSFDRKLQFFKMWKYVMPSILFVALIFIGWDIFMTKWMIWGFNSQYHSNILLLGLPIEEILFFVVVPYASLFLHYSFVLYFPKIQLDDAWTQRITKALVFGFIIIAALNFNKTYTIYILATTLIALFLGMLDRSRILNSFYVTFLLILIPFLLVNGVLTGSFIEGEVVWYNDAENLGKRFFTIPYEDFAYGFSLVFFNLILTETLKSKGEIFRRKIL